MHTLSIPTPVGLVLARAGPRGIRRVELRLLEEGEGRPNRELLELARRIERYFDGQRETFCDLPLDYEGLEARRVSVYEAVRRIPVGQTRSYAEVAYLLGLTPRAVGAALRANPFFLVVPAQRVIHADGRLGGFAGREGVKEWLLRFEGAWPG